MQPISNQIWVLVGTRPEVIKQAPLYLELVRKLGKEKVALVGTGQHQELLIQALEHFGVEPDLTLGFPQDNQTLHASSARILNGIGDLIQKHNPAWLIVQGDTTSAAMAAWAAFQNHVRVAHNEAGLRSFDLQHPFPEEANRRLISIVADIHFAPTSRAKAVLEKERADPSKILQVGNTGIDALRWTLSKTPPSSTTALMQRFSSKGLLPIFVTAHRRENKENMDAWFSALRSFLLDHPQLGLVYPFHPNNAAKPYAEQHLGDLEQAVICPPLSYAETCHFLLECRFVVTDSGGLQEEATSLGIPTVVCRKTTERMEAVDAGYCRLTEMDPDAVLEAMNWAFAQKRPEIRGIHVPIFGDGKAAERIAEYFEDQLKLFRE